MTVIGMFDSGVGGLSVLAQVLEHVAPVDIVYFADNAHLPYGERSKEELQSFTKGIISHLKDNHGADAIIIACNSSSAAALDLARAKFALPILSVLEAGVEGALSTTEALHIGVIATSVTVKSGAYQRMLGERSCGVRVTSAACPPLVPLVERGELSGQKASQTVRDCLEPFQDSGIDTLILGCTHYTFLTRIIAASLPKAIEIVDPALHVAKSLLAVPGFTALEKEVDAVNLRRVSFYTSGDPGGFSELAGRLLGVPVRAEKEDIW